MTGSIPDTYCLKQERHQENTLAVFSNLRDSREFSDVTLVCEGGETLEAHKVILTAYSPLFRNMLKQKQQPNPIIFMHGIKLTNLTSILDFIYRGEASVENCNLSDFVSLAKVLELDDLSNDEADVEQNPFFSPNKQKSKTLTRKTYLNKNIAKQKADKLYEMTEDTFNSLEEQVDFLETTMDQTEYFSQLVEVIKPDTDTIKVADIDHFQLDNMIDSKAKEQLSTSIESMIEQENDYWVCKMCGKKASTSARLRPHIETHITGMEYPCNLCGKSYRTRPSFYNHKAKVHKNN